MKLDPQGCKAAEAALQEMHFDSYGMIDEIAEAAINAYLSASNSGEVVAYMYTHDGMIHDDEHPALLSVKRWSKCEEPWNETPLYLAPRAPEASPEDKWNALKGDRDD